MTDRRDPGTSSASALGEYRIVADELLHDADLDVELTPDGLRVRGKLFAFLEGSELVVELPAERAEDLRTRGVAVAFTGGRHSNRNWVKVSDLELWSELAREAHEFVGEPPIGRQS